jgi:Apea-like HEPN
LGHLDKIIGEVISIMPRVRIQALIQEASASGLPLDRLRGYAFYDMRKDERVTALNSFAAAEQAVVQIPEFAARLGADNARRVTLQCVYQYFGRMEGVRYDEAAFNTLWNDFTAEIADPAWVTRGIANVKFFASENLLIDLGDGVSIRGRNPEELSALGFGSSILGRIMDDWFGGFGASSFVLVAEDSVPKAPANLISTSDVWTKAIRAIGACRLAAPGSISIGAMWVTRVARFNFGIGGLSHVGASIPTTGSSYQWSAAIGTAYPQIYAELKQLEKIGYGASPGNLDIALRSFMGTYDRWPNSWDSQLLDATTALEALLGTGTDIAFKLAFRVAALLAANDNERAQLLKTMKDFYDTRSKLVHGATLKAKHHQCLQRVDDLRSLVRRLLRAFVGLAANPPEIYNKAFFNEQLDMALIDATERERLRTALGLNL